MHKRLDAASREPYEQSHLQKVPESFKQLVIPVLDDVQPNDNGGYSTLSSNAIVQILNILVDMKVKPDATLQTMTPAIQALHERIEKLNLMDANLWRSWSKGSWHRHVNGSRDWNDQWVLHTWYMQSGSLLGKDFETLRLRPERLYVEDRERKNRFVQPGDTLAIYIPSVLPENGDPPVIQAGRKIVVGFPVPVSRDGSIQLRLLEPINVKDLELSQVEDEILRRYSMMFNDPKTMRGTTVQFLLRANNPQELRNLTGTGLAPNK